MKKSSRSPAKRGDGARRRLFIVIALCIALLVVLNMLIIFRFSASGKEESGSTSEGVTRMILRLFYPNFTELNWYSEYLLVSKSHAFIRKAAHFCEFALLGFLSGGLLLFVSGRLKRMRGWMPWVIPAVFTLLYAILDEIHQIFSNRGPRVTDVLIDFWGACCGILLIHGLVLLLSRLRRRENQERSRSTCKTQDSV